MLNLGRGCFLFWDNYEEPGEPILAAAGGWNAMLESTNVI